MTEISDKQLISEAVRDVMADLVLQELPLFRAHEQVSPKRDLRIVAVAIEANGLRR